MSTSGLAAAILDLSLPVWTVLTVGLGHATTLTSLSYSNSDYLRGTELDNVTYKVQYRAGLCFNVPWHEAPRV